MHTGLRRLAAVLLGGGLLPWVAPAAQAAPQVYDLDPAHSFVTFELLHFGTSTIRGRFGPLEGQVTLDRAQPAGEVRLTVPVATLDTGWKVFDHRILGPELLAADAFPAAYFIATRFRFDPAGGVAEVRGEFTLRGHGEPLSLVAERFSCRQGARLQREVCGGDFTGRLQRSDFGLTFGLPFVGNEVTLKVQVEGIAR